MTRNIFLFSPIDAEVAKDIVEQLLSLNKQSKEDINLFINSPGGYVVSAFSIIDTMNAIESKVNTIVMGDAASAGSLISSFGDKRLISENSRIMIHEVSAGTFGKISTMKDDIKKIDEMNDKLAGMLARNTGKTLDEIKTIFKKGDKWFSAKEAVNFGIADEVIDKDAIKKFKLSDSVLELDGFGEITNKDNTENSISVVPLFKVGNFHTEKYGELNITPYMLEKFKENFEKKIRGVDISIDTTHDNDGGEKKAAGWIKEVVIDGGELNALVEFTKEGRELVSQKAFKYASAEFVMNYTDEQGSSHPFVLLGATLTNRPVIKNKPIKLSEGSENMNKEQLIAALKEHGCDVTALEADKTALTATIDQLTSEKSALESKVSALQGDSDELKKLQESITAERKETTFNALVKEGKEVPARKDLVLGFFKDAEAMKKAYESAPVIVKVEAKGDQGEQPEGLTEQEQNLVKSGKYTKEQVIASREFKG